MIVRDISFEDPLTNLQHDDQMLRAADSGQAGEVLRFWESPSVFVVMGRSGDMQQDVNLVTTQADGVPVLRRSSGGGTVVQGPGCLNFALVLSRDLRPEVSLINRSYRYILDQILAALQSLQIPAEFRPVCDLVLAGTERKFSGNAQRRGRIFLLHHGTILYNFDLSLIARYLKMPARMPEYRKNRPHADFVANIPASRAALIEAVTRTFVGAFGIDPFRG